MPHYRKLWRKFTESQDVNDMADDTTRLAWALLPLALDREGLGLDNPAWLRAQLFPLREDITIQQVRDMMDWWAERGMILRYAENGKQYIFCPTFRAYQGNLEREAKSEIPLPPPDLCTTNSRPILEQIVSGSGTQAPEQVPVLAPEQEQEQQQAQTPETREDAIAAAVAIGFAPDFALQLVEQYGAWKVQGHIDSLKSKKGIKDPPAFVRSELEKGHSPPPKPDNSRRRFIEGKYADCIQH